MLKHLKNINIWFDLDEVLSDTVRLFLDIYQKKWLISLERENCTNYWLEQIPWYNIKPEYWQEFIRTDAQLYAQPIVWAFDVVSNLKNNWNKIIVITGRHDFEKDITVSWLDKYFPNLIEDVIFINHSLPTRKNKSEYILKFKIKAFVDDHYDHCTDIAQTGIPVYMPTKPWNAHYQDLPANIYRIQTLDDLSK